jgi:hypothetical protein
MKVSLEPDPSQIFHHLFCRKGGLKMAGLLKNLVRESLKNSGIFSTASTNRINK